MYFVLAHVDNGDSIKRFLLPKHNEHSEDWVEITIDQKAGKFYALKVKGKFKKNDEWVQYKDSTFATSLFSHFLRDELDV
jgi:hypothetical protein